MNAPYKGLMPYSEQDAPYFFGRTAEQEIIIANMNVSRLTLLYGASGVGKSSILRAGIAHQLRGEARRNLEVRGTPEFGVVVFSSWRDDPIAGLVERVEDEVKRTLSNGSDSTRRTNGTTTLADALKTNSERVGGDLYIILDQFEEYFLYHPDDAGEGTFAHEFPRVLNRDDLRVSFLLAIREDALAKLDRFKGRIPNLFDNYLRMEHLDRDAAREAILRPLEAYNRLQADGDTSKQVSIEPALVEAVLEQTRTGQVILGEAGRGTVEHEGEQIETPYLQLVMTRLWEETVRAGEDGDEPEDGKRTGGFETRPYVMRLGTLERLGGAEKIVRTHLDTTMGALPPEEQETAARIFNFLVTPSGAKIAHTAQDLSDYAKLPADELKPTLEKLSSGDVRILRPVAPPLDQPASPRYEIFHDVLGAPILDWRARYLQGQEKIEGEKKLAAEKRRVRRLRLGLIGLSALLLAVIALAVFAFTQREAAAKASSEAEQRKQEAEEQRADAEAQRAEALTQKNAAEGAQAEANAQKSVALSREVAANSIAQVDADPERALLLAIAAAKISHNPATEGALRAALNDDWRATLLGHTDEIVQGNYSPDGTLIATASKDGTVRIWDAVTRKEIAQMPWKPIEVKEFPYLALAFSPDSRLVAVADLSGTVQIWQARTGTLAHELAGHSRPVNGVGFSPDGKQLISWSNDRTARVWNPATGDLTFQITWPRRGIWIIVSAGFSPDGKLIFTGVDDLDYRPNLYAWDAATGNLVTTFDAPRPLRTIFSPDGLHVATINGTGADLYSVVGTRLAQLRGPTDLLVSIAFSPDSKTILAGSGDATAWLWDAASGVQKGVLGGHQNSLRSAVFSPRGTQIATASDDQTIRLWYYGPAYRVGVFQGGGPGASNQSAPDASVVQLLGDLRGHTGGVNSAVYSPDGKSLLSVSDDATARIWNVYQGTQLLGHKGAVLSAAAGPEGKLVVTTGGDGTARVWEAGSGKPIAELVGHKATVTRAVFSPDGRIVATASGDGTVRLWDPLTGESRGVLGSEPDGAVNDIAFSPTGDRIAVAQDCARGQDATNCMSKLRVSDAGTGELVLEGPEHGRGAASVRFTPDGKSILSAAKNNSAMLWDAETGSVRVKVEGTLPRNLGAAGIAELSADGKRILTLSAADGVPQVWDTATGKRLFELRGHQDKVTSAAFSPDGTKIVTGSDDNTARVWDAASGGLLLELKGHTDGVNSVAFSPNGKLIVTSSDDYSARLWDAETGKTWRVLRDHTKALTGAIFSPDGRWIVTTSNDTTAQVFPCDVCGSPDELAARAQARVTRELTCQERFTFLHETVECQ